MIRFVCFRYFIQTLERIGQNVVFAAINHDLDTKNNCKNHYVPITIGNPVWIGANATVLDGIPAKVIKTME